MAAVLETLARADAARDADARTRGRAAAEAAYAAALARRPAGTKEDVRQIRRPTTVYMRTRPRDGRRATSTRIQSSPEGSPSGRTLELLH